MKASEINLKKQGRTFSCNTYAPHSHYKMLMMLGRVFPTTTAQAKHFITTGYHIDVLNADDVERVETMLNKHGYIGKYNFTKSKMWVRLQNQGDLHEAIKKEFNL
jgi:hypothetical protein